jgi:hypothetical protein
MKVLGIRFCAVAEEAIPMAQFFTRGLGLPERDLGGASDVFQGPMEAHGEKIYFAVAPGGLSVSFQEVL